MIIVCILLCFANLFLLMFGITWFSSLSSEIDNIRKTTQVNFLDNEKNKNQLKKLIDTLKSINNIRSYFQ